MSNLISARHELQEAQDAVKSILQGISNSPINEAVDRLKNATYEYAKALQDGEKIEN